jgi:DNA helicase II / ATP-dependent DNA helicase PcrA
MTAASLANGGKPSRQVDPNIFRHGMVVLHPTFGLGQIVALSGEADRRKATVDFPTPTGRKSLLLSEGFLQPVGPQ